MRRIKKSLALCLILVISLLAMAGCGGSSGDNNNAKSSNKDMIVANIDSEPQTIDPALNNATGGSTIIFNIFEGLARMGNDDRPEAGIAKDWEVLDDGTRYVFHLRDGLKWSDGEPLTAEDIRYGIIRVLDSKTASAYPYHAYCIKNGKAFYDGKAKAEDVGVKAVDEKTLEIQLEHPVPHFLDIISWHLLLPVRKDIVEKDPDGWAQKPETLVTNGPFKVAEWKHNEYILLEKNPYYWDKDNVKVDKVKLVMIADENTALTAFKTGKIDYMSNLPAVQMPKLLKSGEAKAIDALGTYFYVFNVNKKPLDDPKVRKALALAIDREALVKTVTQGGEKPSIAFIPYGIPGASDDKDFRSESGEYIDKKANLEEAKKLLSEAGYPEGKGLPELTLLYNTNENHKAIAEAIQAMWKELGVNIKLANQEWKVFIESRAQGDFDIARHGYYSDFNDQGSLFELWETGSPNNDANYSNSEYDNLVQNASKEQDPVKRAELYKQAEEILMRDMPVAPIYYYNIVYLLNSRVKGLHISKLGWEFFREAYIEE